MELGKRKVWMADNSNEPKRSIMIIVHCLSSGHSELVLSENSVPVELVSGNPRKNFSEIGIAKAALGHVEDKKTSFMAFEHVIALSELNYLASCKLRFATL